MNRLLLLFLFVSSSFSLSAQTTLVNFEVDTAYGCGPLTVHFRDMTMGTYPVVYRQWSFGDGTYSNEEAPAHTYTQRGRYQVELKVKDSNGGWYFSEAMPGNESHAINVYPALNPRYHQYQLCSDSILLKSNEDFFRNDTQTYLWSTGQTTPDIKVKSAGKFTVSVNSCGQTITDSIIVTSGTASLAPLYTGSNWAMDTFTMIMKLNVPYPYNAYSKVHWTWGDSTRYLRDRNYEEYHWYQKPGSYKVIASVTLRPDISSICSDTMATYDFNIREPYVHHNSWNNRDTSLIQGDVLRMFDTENPGADYFWYGTNDNTSSNNGLAISSPGTYYVSISKNGDYIQDTINVKLDTTSLHAKISIDGKNCNTVTFTDSSFSTNSNGINYAIWSFGDGSKDSSGAYHLTHTYTQNGNYTVSLIVSNVIGTLDTAYQTVTIDSKPQIDLIQDTTILSGSPLTLKDLLHNVNSKYRYRWSTGDTAVLHVTTEGVYTLSATYCGNITSDSIYIRVATDTPHVNFTYVSAPCDPRHITFRDITPALASPLDSVVTYSWDFGNQKTAFTKIASTDYQTGTYNVVLKVTTLSGLTATISKPIVVADTWKINAEIDELRTGWGCMDTAEVVATAVGTDAPYTISWNKQLTNGNMVFNPGQYIAYLKDSCGNIRAADTLNITINDPLSLSLNKVRDTLYGSLSNFTYYPNHVVVYTWKWYRNDTLLTGETQPYIIPSISGTYKAVVQSNAACTLSSAPFIYTAPPAKLTVDYTYIVSLCNPQEIRFDGIVNGQDSIVAYTWSIGTGAIWLTKNTSIRFTAGTYNVTFSVTTASGDTANITKSIVVADDWKVHAEIINLSVGVSCRDTATIDARAEGVSGHYSITWNKPLINKYWALNSGTYIAYLKDSCGNVRATDSLNIVLNDPLTVSIHQNNDTLYGSLSKFTSPYNPTYTWKWYRNDTLLSGQTFAYIIPAKSGMYKAVVTSSLGCTATADPVPYIYTTVPQPTSVDFTYQVSPCNRQILTFTGIVNSRDSIVKYEWIINNQVWYTKNFTDNFTPDVYLVRFRVTDINGDTTSIFQQIMVLATLPWVARIANETLVCADTATLTANVFPYSGGYLWSNGDTARTIRVTTQGRYSLLVKDSCNTIRATDSIDVVLDPPAKASIRLARNYSDTLIASEGIYYYWYKDNIELGMEHQKLLFPTASGSYTVNVISPNGCGRTSVPFIYTLPVPDTITTNVGTITDSTLRVTTTFNHDFNADNIFTAELMLDDNGGRTTGLQPQEVISLGSVKSSSRNIAINIIIPDSLACADNYVIRIKASSPADTTTWSKQFAITNQPAQPVITQRGDSLFTSGIYNWQWYKNNTAIEGATNAKYRASANGTYKVESKNGTGCSSMSSEIAVVITAVGEVTLGSNTVKAYPNPSEGLVHLQFSKPLLKMVTVKVHSLQGRLVYSTTTQQQLLQLDLTHLPKGYYLIEVAGYGTQKTLTVVLQ
ncbi:Por secretion system C-terminal sorting domain-containing protein [Chitinophaga sp. CF118]|uniref:PKD domain-containing protein n=1 Tax=Chitinophaga sp. CF118 TaxID=1884367 RepID=UPI0008E2B317|nr:PKD domain-containing protein [Chitinophaga sp. CF118]SFE05615.1 Por secretion system C-terminal sorting domain-containing protein [Chitinophaga sp. CF118]